MTPKPWLPLVLLLAACGPDADDSNPAEARTVTHTSDDPNHDLAYGDDPAQRLDFYPGENKGPLVVFVHGGAWQSGSRHEYDGIASKLQGEGMAVATVDYRLSPAVQHPAHAEDVAAALMWLKDNAAKRGFDKDRIFLVGHSAGAHIAATIAADPKATKPAGYVGLEGIYDIPNLAKRWPTYPSWFLLKAFGDAEKWPAASPTLQPLASKAPWLLVHSKADELVDLPQTLDYAAHLRKEGVKVETLTPASKTHFGVVQSLSRPDDDVAQAIVKFIKSQP
jgi:acetyl esterase/lipase